MIQQFFKAVDNFVTKGAYGMATILQSPLFVVFPLLAVVYFTNITNPLPWLMVLMIKTFLWLGVLISLGLYACGYGLTLHRRADKE